MKKLNLTTLILIIILMIGNCAFTDSVIKYEYNSKSDFRKDNNFISIVFNKIDDAPNTFKDGLYVDGIKKNGFGIEGGFVYIKPRAPIILKDLFNSELKNAGFNVINIQNGKSPEIEIQVNQFYVEPEVGLFAADVIAVIDINVIINFKNKIFSRRFKSIGVSTTPFWIDYFYYIAIERSMNNLANKTIPEIIKLINKEYSKDF